MYSLRFTFIRSLNCSSAIHINFSLKHYSNYASTFRSSRIYSCNLIQSLATSSLKLYLKSKSSDRGSHRCSRRPPCHLCFLLQSQAQAKIVRWKNVLENVPGNDQKIVRMTSWTHHHKKGKRSRNNSRDFSRHRCELTSNEHSCEPSAASSFEKLTALKQGIEVILQRISHPSSAGSSYPATVELSRENAAEGIMHGTQSCAAEYRSRLDSVSDNTIASQGIDQALNHR